MVTANPKKRMRIVSLNANGLRSAASKGLFPWLVEHDVDILCLQETKAHVHQLTAAEFAPAGYHRYFFDAQRKGYSGVAIYTRWEAKNVQSGLGFEHADTEGRYIECDFGRLRVASIYFPSGSSGEDRQAVKYIFMENYFPRLKQLAESGTPTIICGDWNIAHKAIDLKNWRGNQKNSGFLPAERAWLDEVFGSLGLVDAFRVRNTAPEQYTWWSNRGQAWAKNVGWRIDYQIVTADLAPTIRTVDIYKAQRFSDHAPLIIDYEIA